MDTSLRASVSLGLAAVSGLLMVITLISGPLILDPSARAVAREMSTRLGPRRVINGVSNITPEQEATARNAARDTVLRRTKGREAALFAFGGAVAFGFGVSARSRRRD
jgi:hypothetical protein